MEKLPANKDKTLRYIHPAGNKGSTLVELLVAMSLLLGVILPAGAFLGYAANFPVNKEKIIALGDAQQEMEELIGRLATLDGLIKT